VGIAVLVKRQRSRLIPHRTSHQLNFLYVTRILAKALKHARGRLEGDRLHLVEPVSNRTRELALVCADVKDGSYIGRERAQCLA
jgi:hypothetical protein